MYKDGYVDDVYTLNTHVKIMLIEKNHQLGSPVLDEDFRRKFELYEKWLRKNK